MKIFKKILFLLISLSLLLLTASCNEAPCTEHSDTNPADGKCDTCGADVAPDEGGEGDGEGEGEGEGEADTGEFVLIEDGVARFQFVLGSSVPSGIRSSATRIATALEKLGIKTTAKREDEGSAQDCEILIGNVSTRGEAYEYDMYSLGMEGYVIKAIDENKVIIGGGSDEMLLDAFNTFVEDYLGYYDDVTAEEIWNVSVADEDWVEEIQDGYDIESVTINGSDAHGYSIVYPQSGGYFKNAATSLSDALYEYTGYYLPTTTKDNVEKGIFLRHVSGDQISSAKGFEIVVEGDNVLIKCAHQNSLETALNKFIEEEIIKGEGELSFDESYIWAKIDISKVKYSDFGAVGNGVTNDFEAIKAAHDFANAGGQTVYADAGANYYIGHTGGKIIHIRTNTVWRGATFTIDDSIIQIGDPDRTTNIFALATDYHSIPLSQDAIDNITDENGRISASATKLNYAPGYPTMLVIRNSNHMQYIRYGGNANSGTRQQELVVLDGEGNIDPTTKLLFDFDKVTSITAYRIDDTPITIEGGTVHTIANNQDKEYNYYSRGISINRSNTTIKGVSHTISGEGESGAPYSGFLSFSYCSNSLVIDCNLVSHKVYKENDRPDGSSGTSMGTYDIGGSMANGLYFKRCIQTNFRDENGDIISASKRWGIMGTNFCKNITYDESVLSRLDAHCGVYNASIIKSTVIYTHLIGGGEAKIIDSDIYNSNLVTLRSDYGSTWNGTIYIKDVRMHHSGAVTIFHGMDWANHDFGYTCHLPTTLELDGIEIIGGGTTIYLFGDPTNSKQNKQVYDFNAPTVPQLVKQEDGSEAWVEVPNINRYVMTEYLTVKNLDKKYTVLASPDLYMQEYFADKFTVSYKPE